MGPTAKAGLAWMFFVVVGTAVIWSVMWTYDVGPGWLVPMVAAFGLAPLAVARRFPVAGSLLACGLLSAVPQGLLMTAMFADEVLVAHHEICGTGAYATIFFVPFMQGVLAIPAVVIWFLRRRLAAVWRPVGLFTLAVVLAMTAMGVLRTVRDGAVDHGVLRDVEGIEIAAGVDEATVGSIVVHRRCDRPRNTPEHDADHCQTVVTGAEGQLGTADVRADYRRDAPLTVYPLGRFALIEGSRMDHPDPFLAGAVDTDRIKMVDLRVSDVAQWRGPQWSVLLLALFGAMLTAVSMAVPATRPLVWRRLGAKSAERHADQDDVISLGATHLAVLLVLGLPLFASAVLGLVV